MEQASCPCSFSHPSHFHLPQPCLVDGVLSLCLLMHIHPNPISNLGVFLQSIPSKPPNVLCLVFCVIQIWNTTLCWLGEFTLLVFVGMSWDTCDVYRPYYWVSNIPPFYCSSSCSSHELLCS
jgi:hypothetical protein